MNASLGQQRPSEISCVCRVILLILCTAQGRMAFAEKGNSRSETSQLVTVTLHTELVPGSVEVAVLLPAGFDPGSTPHTLLLWLHGGPDDSSYLKRELRPIIDAAWERKELPPLVVAVPSARRSFYMDFQDDSQKWESLILKEVIPTLRKKYGLRKDKGGTLIGGYSMGGMGSLRMAFKHPERFGAVAAIAPAIEPAYQFGDIQPRDREYRSDAVYERIYGKPVDHGFWQANHPPTLARDRARQIRDSELKVYIEVGSADELGLFRGGEFLHDTLLQKRVSHEYRLVHGAAHGGETLPSRLADAVRFLGRVSGGVDAQATREVKAHLEHYLDLFNQEKALEISQEIFETPVLIRKSGDKHPMIAQTNEDVQQQFEAIFTSIKAKGWKRSVINRIPIHLVGPDMAIVEWDFSRLKADGQVIPPTNRIGNLTLIRRNGRWRIISVLISAKPQQTPDPRLADEVKNQMQRYLQLLNQEDAAGVARDIYQLPLLVRGFSSESQTAVMSKAAAQDRLAGVLKGLKAKGLKQFVSHGMNVRVLNSDLAAVELVSARVRQDGTIIPPGRTTFTYVWIKHDNQWRMISVLYSGLAKQAEDADSVRELEQHMNRYVTLFNAADAEAIAKEIYSAPVLFPQPGNEQHSVLETTADVQRHWTDTFAEIKSGGWERSVVHDMRFRVAGPDLAFVGMTFSRLRSNGEAIPPDRRIAEYVLLKSDAGWRIILVSSQAERDRQSPVQTITELTRLMGRYIDLLNGERPATSVVNEIYQAPRLSLGFMEPRKHKAVLTKQQAEESLDNYLQKLKAEGLDQIVVHSSRVRPVSKNLAFVELISNRVRKDGTPIPPANTPFTYVWLKKSTGWRMIATLAHGIQDRPTIRIPHRTTASFEDFRDYCAASLGRWAGEVTSVASETSVGRKNGKTLTYNYVVRMAHGGNAMIREVTGPNSDATAMIFYDASAQKIRTFYASSKGVLNRHTIHREGNHWIRHTQQTAPDGARTEFQAALTFSNRGNTKVIVMNGKKADGTTWEQTNVWHRTGKPALEPATSSEKFSIDRLDWLTGRWQGPAGEAVLEESWLPPKSNSLAATVRLTKDGQTEFVEIIKIQKVADTLELRLRLFDSELKPHVAEPQVYEAITQTKHSITFHGVTPQAHRTLHYELAYPGRFIIRFESHDGQKTEITLTRPAHD